MRGTHFSLRWAMLSFQSSSTTTCGELPEFSASFSLSPTACMDRALGASIFLHK